MQRGFWTTDYSKRVYGLDLFRAIAIILVVHGHGKFMLEGTPLQGFPWISLPSGVDLFFVLSGFLIGSILLKLVVKLEYRIDLKSVLSFWRRRWFRTLPNYYLILLVNILLVRFNVITGDISQFNYKFFFFLQNFNGPFYDFFWESWSLSVEEWFYIFLPLFLLLLLKCCHNRIGVFGSIALMLLFPLVYRIAISGQNVDWFWHGVRFGKVVLARMDTIAFGVLAAAVKFYRPSFWKSISKWAFVFGFSIILVLRYVPLEPNAFFTKTFYYTLMSFGCMLLLPLADGVVQFKHSIGKVVTHISLISYSMYLVNLALAVQVIQSQFPIVSSTDGALKYVAYWIFVLTVSTALYFFFEKPMMQLRDRGNRTKVKATL